MKDVDNVLQVITDMFLGKMTKRKVHKHRCYHCGKVTKHVFCDECYQLPKQEREIYYESTKK